MITHDMHLMLEYTPHAIVISGGRKIGDDSAVAVLTDAQMAEQANLKLTSLYELAQKAGLPDPQQFVQQFIDYEDSNLVKLNGMAWFKPKHDRYLYEATDNTADRFEQMLRTNSFNAENFISYAWEEDNDFIEKVLPLTRDTETLVIIGYSLPDVNRIVDHRLISGMKNLKNVVIQDRNCEQIKGRFLDLLSDEKRSELENRIRFETNLSSFYIPLSLSL